MGIIWIALLVFYIDSLLKFRALRKETDSLRSNVRYLFDAKKVMYQVDVFVLPYVEAIGKDIKKLKNDSVRYKYSKGMKKYDSWDLGKSGFFYNKRRYGYDKYDSYVFLPTYNENKEICMPVRITQMRDKKGVVLNSFDNIEKEPWFQNNGTICFNYCEFELLNEDNMITFIPFYMNCDGRIRLRIEAGECFFHTLFEFPLDQVVYYMIAHHYQQCLIKEEGVDCYLSEDERKYKLDYYAEDLLKKECFECIQNDCLQSVFDNKFGTISIVLSPVEISL